MSALLVSRVAPVSQTIVFRLGTQRHRERPCLAIASGMAILGVRPGSDAADDVDRGKSLPQMQWASNLLGDWLALPSLLSMR